MNRVSADGRVFRPAKASSQSRRLVFPAVMAMLAALLVAVTAALYVDMPRTSGQAVGPRVEDVGYQPDSNEPPVMDARLES